MRALTLSGLHSCQSAVLMNNLAEAYASMGQYEEAKVWGQKGLDIAQNPNTKKLEKDGKVCDYTCGILLFNMGMLFEVSTPFSLQEAIDCLYKILANQR